MKQDDATKMHSILLAQPFAGIHDSAEVHFLFSEYRHDMNFTIDHTV